MWTGKQELISTGAILKKDKAERSTENAVFRSALSTGENGEQCKSQHGGKKPLQKFPDEIWFAGKVCFQYKQQALTVYRQPAPAEEKGGQGGGAGGERRALHAGCASG